MIASMTHQPQTMHDVSSQPAVRRESETAPRAINVGWNERRLSLIGGAGLVLLGLARRSLAGAALAAAGGLLTYRGVTGRCGLYRRLGMNTARDDRGPDPKEYFGQGIHVERSFTIERPAEELFGFWRDFQNLPRFMRHLRSVQVLDEKRSRWVSSGPAGLSIQWDAEIINEEPNALIAWKSTGGADVDNAGSVRFFPAPGGRGTEVRVVLDYIPPAGQLGALFARVFGEAPAQQIDDDLRHFKQLMECGEIPTTEGQPRGACRRIF
jgi:uncharacterized membrane protein